MLEPASTVMTLAERPNLVLQVRSLLARYELTLYILPEKAAIPGSYWGEPEAGLIKDCVYARLDTPLHSILHESCHVICMDAQRRAHLHTDANGRTPTEESAVCYLQIILADYLPEFGKSRALKDMDAWGYSFRSGSAQCWFAEDSADAQHWLYEHGLLEVNSQQPTFKLRN